MGSKHELAPEVAALVGEYDEHRPFLDLFCGMCSVGGAIAPSGRAVWGNDVQWCASSVAKCLLTSVDEPIKSRVLSERLRADFETNYRSLQARFRKALARETGLLRNL